MLNFPYLHNYTKTYKLGDKIAQVNFDRLHRLFIHRKIRIH